MNEIGNLPKYYIHQINCNISVFSISFQCFINLISKICFKNLTEGVGTFINSFTHMIHKVFSHLNNIVWLWRNDIKLGFYNAIHLLNNFSNILFRFVICFIQYYSLYYFSALMTYRSFDFKSCYSFFFINIDNRCVKINFILSASDNNCAKSTA